ncbi:nicotinate (nicotinamide) nucleotide adenylyltransferase [bacterium]|nr:nicotinate (nicotinamide) nucleotide adenylyltransferase [bacterium]
MKILLFGGTYNPIHVGHILSANSLYEILKPDKVIFLVSANPPHKKTVSFETRFEMVRLALKNFPNFEASDLENRLEGVSYTYKTLEELHKIYPNSKFFFAVGEDNVLTFEKWKNPERICELAEIVVLERKLNLKTSFKTYKTRFVEVSSTEIRKRIKEGLPISYLVPEAVENFIKIHKLYKD